MCPRDYFPVLRAMSWIAETALVWFEEERNLLWRSAWQRPVIRWSARKIASVWSGTKRDSTGPCAYQVSLYPKHSAKARISRQPFQHVIVSFIAGVLNCIIPTSVNGPENPVMHLAGNVCIDIKDRGTYVVLYDCVVRSRYSKD